MSIQRLCHASLIGLSQYQRSVLDGLQSLGVLHLLAADVALPAKKLISDESMAGDQQTLAINPEDAQQAIKYLSACQRIRRQELYDQQFNAHQLINQVAANRQRLRDLADQRVFLQRRIADLRPWGSFDLPDLKSLDGQRLWFYRLPLYRVKEMDRVALAWQQVHKDHRYAYIVVIDEDEPAADALPIARTHTGSVSLSTLQGQLAQTERDYEEAEIERESLSRWLYCLQCSLAVIDDQYQLGLAEKDVWQSDALFVITAWVTEDQCAALQAFAEANELALQLRAPLSNEKPPTALKNPVSVAAGENLIGFFKLPAYQGWDPSRLVFFSFVCFFAVIMSDAGYALLIAAGLAFYWRKLGRSIIGQRMRNLILALVVAGVGWGVLVGGYFGAEPPTAWLASLKVMDINDFSSMMALSITLGVVHLVIANLLQMWLRRFHLSMLASLAWIIILITALQGWLTQVTVWHEVVIGMALMAIVIFSSQKSGWGKQRWITGIIGLSNLSKLFGDVLSYLRLFALGLASASLAITFNQLADQVAIAMPELGVLFKVLILLVGHLLNFTLTVVSGVIHGLRLNLIEFFNWSLADEGYAFRPFKKQEVTPWKT